MNIDYIKMADLLKSYLADLKAGKYAAIEYGDPQAVAGRFSYCRVRYIGSKLCVKFLNALGAEGSGLYYGSDANLIVATTSQLTHYHRNTGRGIELNHRTGRGVKSREMTWFPIVESKKEQGRYERYSDVR